MDEPQPDKRAIRRQILDERAALNEAARAARSAAICATIESLDEYRRAQSILFYMPFKGEVDISPILQKALEQGRRCALPKCGSGRSLRLYAVTDLKLDTEPGMLGIPEPKDCLCECTAEEFPVIIIPGVAFDRRGRRIGYGAGYYDRFLAKAGAAALKIAPAFALQVLPEIPGEAHDVPVDIIVTEEEVIDCRRAGGEHHG